MYRADGRQRIVAGAPAALTWQGVDSSGEPADPGTVTVGVVRADGTVLLAPLTATTGTGTAVRSVALTASQTAALDWLTATWTVSGVVRAVTVHEVVGGVYMTSAALRAAEPSLSDATKYPAAKLLAARDRTERAFEAECYRAFVPRFRVATIRRGMPLPDTDIDAIRFVQNADTGAVVSYTHVAGSRLLDDVYTCEPLLVGYVYGEDAPPADLLEKFAKVVRYSLNATNSGIPDRAMSFQPAEGGNVTLATAGLGPWIYGIPDVDQVIHRHQWRKPPVTA
jgi:hypothetical protein